MSKKTKARIQDESPLTTTDDYEAMIRREVQAYRLRYLCTQSCSKFYQYNKRRSLHGAQVYVALLLIFLERLAYYSVSGNVLDPFLNSFGGTLPPVYQSLIETALFEMVAQLMFPIAGFLGDRYIGRYRSIHISMWLLLFGYTSFTFVASFDCSSDDPTHVNRFLLPLFYVIIAMGSAGFQANMIPFGADQIVGRPSDELSSYFYWYYWVRNLGALIFAFSFTCTNFKCRSTVFGFIAAVSISVALIVNLFAHQKFHMEEKRHNPLKLVFQVVKFVIYAKRPEHRSAFSYTGADPPSRMDLAKDVHGGKFTNVQVEDVKTFLRLLVFLVSLVGVLFVYTGVVNIIALQVKHMNGSFVQPSQDHCTFTDSSVWFFNIGLIVIVLPFLNFCLYPFLREYTPNMQKRIGIGHVFSILSPLTLLVLSSIGFGILSARGLGKEATSSCMFNPDPPQSHDQGLLPLSSWFVLLPHYLISLAEVLVMVSSLEFFYAQSPHTMRGMMVGLFFFTWGVATIIANFFVIFFTIIQVTILTCGIWYYTLLVVLAVFTLVVFMFVSRWYKNRSRGDLQPDLYYRLRH